MLQVSRRHALQLIVTAAILALLPRPGAAHDRTVVAEFFTNYAVTPGPPARAALDEWRTTYQPDVVTIEHHGWWPGAADPFYLYNVTGQRDRVFYYVVNQLPSALLSGPYWVQEPWAAASYEDLYQSRIAVPARATLSLTGTYDPDHRTGDLTVELIVDETMPGLWNLRIAMVEDGVVLDPPGPNGRSDYDDLFRRFWPDAGGVPVQFGAVFPDTVLVMVPFEVDLPHQPAASAVKLVVFLQDDVSQDIEQGTTIVIGDLPGPVAIESTTWGSIKRTFQVR